MVQFDGILIIMITSFIMQLVTSRQTDLNQESMGPYQSFVWNRNSTLIDPCLSAPCLNAGTCISSPVPPFSFQCQCVQGYTGVTCAKGLDECTGNPCIHGACVDNIGSFRCQCYPGFTGDLCDIDIDECQNAPCQNGGVCHQTLPGLYACTCPSGYRGFRCETDIDECMSLSPCQNGGLCREGSPGTYNCRCLPGFTGHDCEFKVPECSSNPCQNGGRCVEGQEFKTFRCHCPEGFMGRLCENQQIIDVCTRSASLCGKHGHCLPTDTTGGYRCLCVNGVVTDNHSCDVVPRNGDTTLDPCKSSPCQNGGFCKSESQGSYRCECVCGFDGAFCQTASPTFDHTYHNSNNHDNTYRDRNNSNIKQCQNGGVCFRQTNGQPRCICPPNYIGDVCEIEFNQCTDGSNPCMNNGTCVFKQTVGVVCHCMKGFTGNSCQQIDTNSTTTTATTTTTLRSFPPLTRSRLDPTLLIVILSVIGTVGVLVGISMLCIYFHRKSRPRDFCFSVPKPLHSSQCDRPDENTAIYNAWIVNTDANDERLKRTFQADFEYASVTPPLSFYQCS